MELLISTAEIAVTIALAAIAWHLIRFRQPGADGATSDPRRVQRQVARIVIVIVALIAVIIALPVSDTLRGQLLGLLGLALSAVIALSSTTFVANAMAGVMLRTVGNFRPGDFIRVQKHFGRVTERDLFHTEIQTQDRDLVTLPNLYLVTQPVQVVHESGTMISATVSLGYDIHHERARECLRRATEMCELADGYVRITSLKDHAVVYRVAGFLAESKRILLARSRLREAILSCLHEAGIEIASPQLLSMREAGAAMPQPPPQASATQTDADAAPDELIFDKAESAAELDGLRQQQAELQVRIDELKVDQSLSKEQRAAREEELVAQQNALNLTIERMRQDAGIDA